MTTGVMKQIRYHNGVDWVESYEQFVFLAEGEDEAFISMMGGMTTNDTWLIPIEKGGAFEPIGKLEIPELGRFVVIYERWTPPADENKSH